MQTAADMPPCWLDDEPARALRSVLDGAGLRAWATGGAVRDGLLGSDLPRVAEILVPGNAARVRRAMVDSPFRLHPDSAYRPSDEAWSPIALRLVPLGEGRPGLSLERDALGRDFTLNAVRCDLSGRIADPLGGMRDIAGSRVRLASPSSLRDDPVRVIRYARMRALVGETEPDREAYGEALAYAPRIAEAHAVPVLRETLRLLLLPDHGLRRSLRDLDRLGALEAVALSPDRHRLLRFLEALPATARSRSDPFLRLGVLGLARGRYGAWIDGVAHRWGDARDRRVAAVAAILSEGAPPDDAVSFVRHGIPSADARAVLSALEVALPGRRVLAA